MHWPVAMLFTQFLVLLAESKLHVDQLTRHEAVLRIQGGRPVTVFHTFDRDVSAMTGSAYVAYISTVYPISADGIQNFQRHRVL